MPQNKTKGIFYRFITFSKVKIKVEILTKKYWEKIFNPSLPRKTKRKSGSKKVHFPLIREGEKEKNASGKWGKRWFGIWGKIWGKNREWSGTGVI